MANDVDQDRIDATTKNENVVDPSAYRKAATERKVSQAYSSIHLPFTIGTLLLLCALIFFAMRRV